MSARRANLMETLVATADRLRRTLRWQPRAITPRQKAGHLAFAALLALGVWGLDSSVPFVHELELKFLDLRYRLRAPPVCSAQLMTLDLDAALIARAGNWPIPRRYYAEMARALKDHGATRMVMDIFLPDESPLVVDRTDLAAATALTAAPETADATALRTLLARLAVGDDERLANALRETGITVLAQTFTPAEPATPHQLDSIPSTTATLFQAMRPDQQRAVALGRRFAHAYPSPGLAGRHVPRAIAVEPPVARFLEHAAGLGFAQVIPDADGIVRKYPMFMEYDGRLYPSLALQAVLLETGVAVDKLRVEPGQHVTLPGAHIKAPGEKSQTVDIRIPVDRELRTMVNWAGDYVDTFRHMPASVLLRFRAIDLAGERFRAMRADGVSPLAMDVTGIVAELSEGRLVSPADAADIVRTLLFAAWADAAELDAGTRAVILEAMDAEDRAQFERIAEQVSINRRLLAGLQADPAAAYDALKTAIAIPDSRDASARHAAARLGSMLRSGRDPAATWPLYFFDPVPVRHGDVEQWLSPLDLEGSIVFVGLTAVGTFDYNPMPFSPRYPMVGLHVNVANSILTRQFIGFLAPRATFAVALLGALMMALLTPRLPPFWGAAEMLLLAGGYAAAACAAFDHAGLWMPLATPLAAMTLTYLGLVIHALFVERNEKRGIREAHLLYKAQVESELHVANTIQASSLPRTFPPFPERKEFDLHAAMDPAKEVGGDLFDFFFTAPHRLFFHVGDVSGKGIPAALFMMTTQTLVRSLATQGGTPGEVLAQVNDHLAGDNDTAMFVTMLCGALDTRTGEVEIANAGHNPPLQLAAGGTWNYFTVPAGRILGVTEGVAFPTHRSVLKPGDALFFYTDGVPEASAGDGSFFSDARLERALAGTQELGMADLIDHIRSEVARFTRGAPPSDDVTMLAIRYHGTG